MLFPIIISVIIAIGLVLYYLYYIAPRLNPLNKADNYLKQNMTDEAIIEYRKLLDKNPRNYTAHYKLSEIYFNQNEIDKGVIHLEEILNIDQYNYEIEKIKVQKRLARAYYTRGEIDRAFQVYFDVLRMYPGDEEALYHVSFISLGQELFDMAQRHFDRLAKAGTPGFEILFGAGIASFQSQKTANAIEYFREALKYKPDSDITGLALAFSCQRRKDYKTGIQYLKSIIDKSVDENALLIAKRLFGIISVQNKKPADGIRIFEELLARARKNDYVDEITTFLYDIGFACLSAEKTTEAYEHWNNLYQLDRGYKKVKHFITILRQEMDSDFIDKAKHGGFSVMDYLDEWVEGAFPPNFLWDICGLKSAQKLDLNKITVTSRVTSVKEADGLERTDALSAGGERIARFIEIDSENFRIIANRVVAKLGYKVDEILQTYREKDGVDFMARSIKDQSSVLIWVRRWQKTKIGEITLRNFAQAVNDARAAGGVFITTGELTQAAEDSLKRLSKISVINPLQLDDLLSGLL